MSLASDRYLDALPRGYEAYAYVDIVPPNGDRIRLTVVDGTLTVDRTAQFRRSGSITCIDPDNQVTPTDQGGILAPLGTEVFPYGGIKYPNGDIEVYPLGVYSISRSTVTESVDQNIQIQLDVYDRSRTISRDLFTSTYVLPTGTNVVHAIKLLSQRTFDDLDFDAVSTSVVLPAPLVYTSEDNPWDAMTALAATIGCEVYFDQDGGLVVAPPPDPDHHGSPHFTFEEGNGTTMTALTATYDDEQLYNGVIVIGQSIGTNSPPVQAVAWDDEPTSPTYYQGAYGQVPLTINDTNITTASDAQAAAESALKGLLGYSAQIDVTSWVNYALQEGDIISVKRSSLGVDGKYVIDSFTLPFFIDSTQTLTARSRRTIE